MSLLSTMIHLAEDRLVAVAGSSLPRAPVAAVVDHGDPVSSRRIESAMGRLPVRIRIRNAKACAQLVHLFDFRGYFPYHHASLKMKASRMRPDLNSLQAILKTRRAELSRDYAVAAIGIFGSYARGSATDNSDVDILVEFDRPIGFFKFLELEERLAEWLGVKVDLVTKAALKPRIGRRILREAVMI